MSGFLVLLVIIGVVVLINVQEKKKRDNMSPEELSEYLEQKRLHSENNKIQRENRKVQQLEVKAKRLEIKEHKIAIKDLKKTARCPRCKSTSLSAHKKGYGIGKGVVGGLIGTAAAGPVGLLGLTAGNIRAKKVRVTCMKCGKQFWA